MKESSIVNIVMNFRASFKMTSNPRKTVFRSTVERDQVASLMTPFYNIL